MPGEPPDPLNIAKRLRDLRDQAKLVREDIEALVALNTANQAAVDAYRFTTSAITDLTSAADSLDPPVPR